jgi:phosphoglycerate dehydrogenase-like enzyme
LVEYDLLAAPLEVCSQLSGGTAIPKIKAVFFYQDEWEAERFRRGVSADVDAVTLPRGTPAHEAGELTRQAHMVIGSGPVRDLDVTRSYPNLKLIQTLSAGTNYLPVGKLAEMGIRVANNHGGNAVAVAEVTVALMVSVYRHLMVQWDQTNNKGTYMKGFESGWERFHELTGKRVGVVGLGQIGSRVAKRLQGWECEVVFHDIRRFPVEYVQTAVARPVEFDELISTSDVITLHVPLDRTTTRLISDREFGMMKRGAILINACRGPVVDEPALVRALDSGHLAGAGLDVTEIEPIEPGNPLIGRDNVVLLPHRAGTSIEAREKSIDTAVLNANLLAEGRDPVGVVLPV